MGICPVLVGTNVPNIHRLLSIFFTEKAMQSPFLAITLIGLANIRLI